MVETKLIKTLFFTVFVALLLSCSDVNRCYETTDSLMVATLAGSQLTKIDSLIVKGIDRNQVGDTIVYDTIPSLSKHFSLPLSLSADSTGFQLFSNGKSATFYINHTMMMKLISADCGFAPEYQLTGSTFSNNIDSIAIADKVVNTKSAEKHAKSQNISIYFHFSDN